MQVAAQRCAHFRPTARPAVARRAVAVRAQAAAAAPALRQILDDVSAAKLGKVRFIVIGDGAILESVSDWTSVRYNDTPTRGTLATIASEDKSFECHISLSKVKEVRFAQSKAKNGDHTVYATRMLGEGDKVLLVALLHGQAGAYEAHAVEAWKGLAAKYGESVKL